MFIAGILLHEAHESEARRKAGPLLPDALASPVGFIALGLGLLAMLLPLPGQAGFAAKMAVLFCAFFLLCLACFRKASLSLPRVFSWLPLRWLGNMSYSYYLLHGLALKAAFLALGTALPLQAGNDAWVFWGLLPFMFALTLVPATVLFLVIERPFSLTPRHR
jgi:peptidoglycan/LPS O-acetylase OafA/YrhL